MTTYSGICMSLQRQIDFDKPMLVAEVYESVSKDAEVVGIYVLVHDVGEVVAARAGYFFSRFASDLMDKDRLLMDAGAPEGFVFVKSVINPEDYVAESYNKGTLRDLPAGFSIYWGLWTMFTHLCLVSCGFQTPETCIDILDSSESFEYEVASLVSGIEGALSVIGEAKKYLDGVGLTDVGLDGDSPSGDAPSGDAAAGDAAAFAPPGMIVCVGFDAGAKVAGVPEAFQQNMFEWAPLASPLPLLGTTGGDGVVSLDALLSLRADFPWMAPVVDRVEERLWLLKALSRSWISLPPMLIHGPSGVGKSYFAKRLAKALGLGFAQMSLSGSTDNRAMDGTARGWSNSRPSWPVCSITMLSTANPLLFVDEVDKVDSTRQGDPLRTMLTMLDHDTAKIYPDPGLSMSCDLSKVSWFMAANEIQMLDTAFRDRVEIVSVSAPDASHLPLVVKGVMADLAASMDVSPSMLPSFSDLAMRRVEELYRSRRSLRGVASHVRSELSKAAMLGARQEERGLGAVGGLADDCEAAPIVLSAVCSEANPVDFRSEFRNHPQD